jgi:hypothetical protein
MYLTHDEYTRMGGDMDAALFIRLEAKARKRIDAMTFGRLQGENDVRECVKHCMFELVQAMHEDEINVGFSGREISSMSNDGISVTYASGNSQTGVQNGSGARYAGIVRMWLTGETDACGDNLLYAGVSVR